MIDTLFRSRVLSTAAIPLSALYRAGLSLRREHRPVQIGARVISIGNIHVGGVGKTPAVIALARHLFRLNRKPAVVSRGYKGRLSAGGAVVSPNSTAEDVGDEPLEIAHQLPEIPVFIGADRVAAAKRAARSAETIILDDGFQHRRIARNIDVVVIPAASDPRRQRVLPWGRLREPHDALNRADAILFVREAGEEAVDPELWRPYTNAEFFSAERTVAAIRPYPGTVTSVALLKRKVVVFSGIANPERFVRTVETSGATVVEIVTKADHHFFSEADIALLKTLCDRNDAFAVTTEKDAARLGGRHLPFPAAVLTTDLACEDFLNFCE